MEQKLLKRKPRKVAPGRAVSMRPPQEKVVLVGTYKGKQLERWTGYYNYPLSEDEFLAAENAKSAKNGRAVAPRPPQSPPVQYWIELDREVAKRRESIR